MFALRTRDLSHIELERSDNISSSSKARTYRVKEVYISTERKTRARIEGFFLLLLLFLRVIRVWVYPIMRLTSQMRCSHLTAFFKFSAKNITHYGGVRKTAKPTYSYDHRSVFLLCTGTAQERPRLPCVKGAVSESD